MRRALLRFGFDCVAQPTIKQAPAAATARLRRLGIGAFLTSRSLQRQAVIYKNSLGAEGPLARRGLRELGGTMRTTGRFDWNCHRASGTILRHRRGGWRWTFQLVHSLDNKKDAEGYDNEIDHERNETSVVPSHCPCPGGIGGSM